jgi:hypothetical protein
MRPRRASYERLGNASRYVPIASREKMTIDHIKTVLPVSIVTPPKTVSAPITAIS